MISPEQHRVEKASAKDLQSAKSLLKASELPVQGLEETEVWCVRDAKGRVIGVAGLETWRTQGLLRSVVIEDDHRNEGLGTMLVKRVIAEAGAKGITELYLITETAPCFFQKFGFSPFDRKRMEGDVLNSIEFREACAETAPVMLLRLTQALEETP